MRPLLLLTTALTLSSSVPPSRPPAVPPPRAGASMTYDPVRRVTLMFGGNYRDAQGQLVYPEDFWNWDGTTWNRIEPAVGTPRPPGRDAAVMVFDEARGRAVLIGGRREDDGLGQGTDVWEWDGTRWYQIANPGFPYILHAFGAYDPVRRRVQLYGGGKVAPDGAFAGMSRTLYEWDGARWATRDSLGPDSVYVAALAVTARGEVLALVTNGNPGGAGTWSYDARWTRREEAPNIRNLQPVASGPDGTIYFFQSWDERLGGPPTLQIRAPNGTWTHAAGEGAGGKGSQSAAWDHHRQRLVVFGGRVGRGPEVDETWEFDGTGWTRKLWN